MIQRSPGCDNPDPSVFQGSRTSGTVDGPSEGSLIEWEDGGEEGRGEDEEEKEEEEEEEAIEGVESDTACSLWEKKAKTNVREMRC